MQNTGIIDTIPNLTNPLNLLFVIASSPQVQNNVLLISGAA